MAGKSTSDMLLEAIIGDIKEEVKKKVEVEIGKAKSDIEDNIKVIKSKCEEATKLLDSVVEDKPLVVTIGDVKKPKKELVHSAFPKVLKILQSQKRKEKNIMLVGEAGSGKTHLVATIAKALGREFYPMSVGLQTTKSDLLGFVNAQGGYVTTPVREAYEKGGVLLLDDYSCGGGCKSGTPAKIIKKIKKDKGLFIPGGYVDSRMKCVSDQKQADDIVMEFYEKYIAEQKGLKEVA